MHKKTILIVEDDKIPQENLVREIGAAFPEYQILTAETLKDARAVLQQQPTLVALVTDNAFPSGENYTVSEKMASEFGVPAWSDVHVGLELMKELRAGKFGQENKNVPIFYQTGGMEVALEKAAHALPGFIQCYTKAHRNMGKQIAGDIATALEHPAQKPRPYREIYEEDREAYMDSLRMHAAREASSQLSGGKMGLLRRLGELFRGRGKND